MEEKRHWKNDKIVGNLFTFELWTQKVVKVEFQSLFASQLVKLSFAGSKYGEVTCVSFCWTWERGKSSKY